MCSECAEQQNIAGLAQSALQRAVAARNDAAAAQLTPASRPSLARLVGSARCTEGDAAAPPDPADELVKIDARANEMATELAADYAADAADVRANGIPADPSASFQAFLTHFGLPPAQGSGFLNRITGTRASTLEQATADELQILSRRFAIVARILSQNLRYTCGDTRLDIGGGCVSNFCTQGDVFAFSCRGNSAIALCPLFWTGVDDNDARAAIVIHELFHVIFGVSAVRQVGEVGDENLRGPGRNYDIAECYEALVDDVFATDSHTNCTPVP